MREINQTTQSSSHGGQHVQFYITLRGSEDQNIGERDARCQFGQANQTLGGELRADSQLEHYCYYDRGKPRAVIAAGEQRGHRVAEASREDRVRGDSRHPEETAGEARSSLHRRGLFERANKKSTECARRASSTYVRR